MSLFEIYFGATTAKHQIEADGLFDTLEIVDFETKEAKKSAEIMQKLRLSNQMIEFRDVFIASSAIIHKLKLITLNKSDFAKIDGLEFFEL